MTTKLTAKRYRTRPTESHAPRGSDVRPEDLMPEPDDGFHFSLNPQPKAEEEKSDLRITPEEITAVEAENLTGRQLRLARRIAAKHNIQASSDHAAVVLLRRAGIDPFQRASLMDLVVSNRKDTDDTPNLPQRIQPIQVPSTEQRAHDSHLRELREIQRDIARRRKRKMLLLFARLAFFVLLPTILAGYYFYKVATPLYSVESEFVIQQSQNPTQSQGLGAMMTGSSAALVIQDSIAVQGYLESREAMERLDADLGFREHFSQPTIDVLQRLPENASQEDVYDLYKRKVKISFDPTEGITRMEVIAEDPQSAVAFSQALIGYAEEQVDQLTQRMREDQMEGARDGYLDAEAKMTEAQSSLVDLQEKFRVISSDVEVTLVTTQLQTLNDQLLQDRLSLSQILSNPNPSQARVAPLQERIARMEDEAQELRNRLTASTDGDASLARLQAQLAMAQSNVDMRQQMLAQSLQAMETARTEAARQTRYLSRSVNPVAPDAPSYPRAFENTLVALLVFLGIYLMISMTVAILREQVSS